MSNLNSVHLMGNLTRDPEVRYTPKGTAVCDISIAINRLLPDDGSGERREEVTYVDVTLWGKTAENAGQYLAKGRSVFVDGRLALETWEDKQSGQKRSKLKVVAESLQFLGSKPAGEAQNGCKPAQDQGGDSGGETTTRHVTTSAGRQGRRTQPVPRPQPARDPDLDAKPEDVPF